MMTSFPDPESAEERGAVEELEVFARSARAPILEELLRRHLTIQPEPDRFAVIRDAGNALVGLDGFTLFIWASENTDPSEATKSLGLSDEAAEWMLRLLILYGPELRLALHAADVEASQGDDWESISRRILWDPRAGDYVVSTQIRKYNGQRTEIKGGLTSAVRLAQGTLQTLLRIENLALVQEADRDALLESIDAVKARLTEHGGDRNLTESSSSDQP